MIPASVLAQMVHVKQFIGIALLHIFIVMESAMAQADGTLMMDMAGADEIGAKGDLELPDDLRLQIDLGSDQEVDDDAELTALAAQEAPCGSRGLKPSDGDLQRAEFEKKAIANFANAKGMHEEDVALKMVCDSDEKFNHWALVGIELGASSTANRTMWRQLEKQRTATPGRSQNIYRQHS